MRFILIFSMLFILNSCNQNNSFLYQAQNDYSEKGIQYEKVELRTLYENPEKYHNKNIEINGFFYSNRNETAIYYDKNDGKGIWISFFKNNLIDVKGNYLLENNRIYTYSNSYIIIRGKFDYEMKGNLSHYKGSITHITYFSDINTE